MQINWCFKGISESASFGDAQARAVLSNTGILSSWMIRNGAAPTTLTNVDAQNSLNANALDDHVNSYHLVAGNTPYISLSAGCVEYHGGGASPVTYAAYRTALDFATDGGNGAGYIFRCWVITGLKSAPELPGIAEEVRDLNLFSHFYIYHDEGEVAAKLFVPRRQVQWVLKVGSDLRPAAASWTSPGNFRSLKNPGFIWPDRVSNVISAV